MPTALSQIRQVSAILCPVNPLTARPEFDRCWPWLLASMREFFETHTKDQIWERVFHGRAFLWPSAECAILGQLVKHPIGILAFNYWLQGGKLDELLTLHPGVEAWARARRCKVVTGQGRDGWARAMEGDWQKGPTTRIKWL